MMSEIAALLGNCLLAGDLDPAPVDRWGGVYDPAPWETEVDVFDECIISDMPYTSSLSLACAAVDCGPDIVPDANCTCTLRTVLGVGPRNDCSRIQCGNDGFPMAGPNGECLCSSGSDDQLLAGLGLPSVPGALYHEFRIGPLDDSEDPLSPYFFRLEMDEPDDHYLILDSSGNGWHFSNGGSHVIDGIYHLGRLFDGSTVGLEGLTDWDLVDSMQQSDFTLRAFVGGDIGVDPSLGEMKILSILDGSDIFFELKVDLSAPSIVLTLSSDVSGVAVPYWYDLSSYTGMEWLSITIRKEQTSSGSYFEVYVSEEPPAQTNINPLGSFFADDLAFVNGPYSMTIGGGHGVLDSIQLIDGFADVR